MTKNTQTIIDALTILKAHFHNKAEHARRNAMAPNIAWWEGQKTQADILITELQKSALPNLENLPQLIAAADTLQTTCVAHSKLIHITGDGRTFWTQKAQLLKEISASLKTRLKTLQTKTKKSA